MNATSLGLVTLACTFGGALLGMWLATVLPDHHLDSESRDIIRLAIGLISTMSALVLGLVIASAKSAFDDDSSAVQQGSANAITLDRDLARYGPETAEIRTMLRGVLAARLELTWPEESDRVAVLDNSQKPPVLEEMVDKIRALSPTTDAQRWLQGQSLDLGSNMLASRWLVLDRASATIPPVFLDIVIAWLACIFASYGLFAPRHMTSVIALFLCALSVAAALFLVLEMYQPYLGIIKVSSEPMRYALAHLGQ